MLLVGKKRHARVVLLDQMQDLADLRGENQHEQVVLLDQVQKKVDIWGGGRGESVQDRACETIVHTSVCAQVQARMRQTNKIGHGALCHEVPRLLIKRSLPVRSRLFPAPRYRMCICALGQSSVVSRIGTRRSRFWSTNGSLTDTPCYNHCVHYLKLHTPAPLLSVVLQGVPTVKAAYGAALRACAKGADWQRGTQLLDNYLEVPYHHRGLCCALVSDISGGGGGRGCCGWLWWW